jgi:uncharacterized protein (TIGR03435 family)
MAYGSELWLISGLPAWADSTDWDIEAKVTDLEGQTLKNLSRQQRGQMLQQILKERFGLVVHTGTKILPVYEMKLIPGSTKLRESAPLPVKDETQRSATWNWRVGDGVLEAKSVTMQTIAKIIGHELERVVVDQTGLKGSYECELHWTPEDSGPGSGISETMGAPPMLFTALREQLGLNLSPAKAPVSILVVDHLERPSPN